MKYVLQLFDDNGDLLLNEHTQVGEVAQAILDNMRRIEEANERLTVDKIRKSIKKWCSECGDELIKNKYAHKKDDICDVCWDYIQTDHIGEVEE